MSFQRGSGAEHPVAHSVAAETDYHRTAVLVVPSLAEPVRPGNVVRGQGRLHPHLTVDDFQDLFFGVLADARLWQAGKEEV